MRQIITLLLASCVAPVVAAASLTGVVFSSGGDPVAGARVRAYRGEEVRAMRARVVRGEEAVPLATAVSAENGEFTFETKLGGLLHLVVEREGFAPAAVQALIGEPGLFVELTPAATRTGRVTASGKPVRGATIVAIANNAAIWTTRTDERGEYTIAEPKPWANALVIVHTDYVPLAVAVNARTSLDVALTRGTPIRGKVVRANGSAVANARVVADDWSIATTGEDGTFALNNAPATARRIDAFDDTSAGSAPRGEGAVTITLERRGSIGGVVRDADNRPLAGASVMAVRENTRAAAPWSGVTDEKGAYRIPHLADGSYHVTADDVASLSFAVTQAHVDGAPARVDIAAQKQSLLQGIVLDEEKKPVAGALVSLSFRQMPLFYGASRRDSFPQTRTGRDGRFRLAGPEQLPPDQPLRLQVTRRGYALASSGNLEPAQRTNIVVTLPKGIELHGVVTNEEGAPVAGAGIFAIEEPFGAAPLPFDRLLASGDFAPFVESDADGTFRLRVNDKPYDLAAWKQGYAGATVGNIRAGGEPVKLVLGKAVTIRGRVDAKGAPIESAVVMAEIDELQAGFAMVEQDGTFVIDGLRPGIYDLQLRAGQRTAKATVQAPASDVVLALAPAATIRGRVVDAANGRTLTDYSVRTETHEFALVNGEESFTLSVQPGLTELTVNAPGYIEATESTTATLEKPVDVTIRLARGRRITGRVTGSDHAPIAQARVVLGEYTSVDLTGADGEFSIDGAPRDAATLRIDAEGYAGTTIELEEGSGDLRRDIVLSRGRSMHGRVVTSDGAPVENANVVALGEPTQRTTTDAAGAFTMHGLAAQPYSFKASRDELESEVVEESAAAGGELVLRMKPSAGAGSIHGTVEGFAGGKWQMGMVQSPQMQRWTMIGRDGKFRIERVAAGEVELRATAQTTDGRSVSTAPVRVTVAPGADVEAKLAFTNDVIVRGVVTESNAPAIGREVTFWGDMAQWTSRTDERGAYEIVGLVPDVLYEVRVAGPREYETRLHVKASSTFDIHMRWLRVEGRVTDPEGLPITGAAITLSGGEHLGDTPEAKSDGTGAFVVEVPAGAYTATIEKDGFATATPRVEAGGPPLLVTMTRTDGVRVRLLDARSGATLGGYAVAIDAGGQQRAKVSDQQKDGTLRLPVAAGTYRIAVSAEGRASQSVRASVPYEGELRVALTPGGTLIVDADRAANDLVKLILPNGEEYVRCQCNGIAEIRLEGKRTTIEHVAPGKYTMQVLDARGLVRSAWPVTIVEGETTVAEIRNPE